MLLNIWNNAPSTATCYVSGILLFYIVGLFCLMIHSIRQRTDEVTFYDVYLELCDVVNYVGSIFKRNKEKKPGEQQPVENDGDQSKNSLDQKRSRTRTNSMIIEGKKGFMVQSYFSGK